MNLGVEGQYLVGSLPGAGASQKVTEAFTKVGLAPDGNRSDGRANAEASFTARAYNVAQLRKQKLVIRPYEIGRRKLIG
jgi:hypothetical protein